MKAKILLFTAFYLFTTGALSNDTYDISILHYNLQNLTTNHILESNPKIRKITNLVKKLSPDILSLNEIQYDLKDVPNSSFKSSAQNLDNINKLISFKAKDSFFIKSHIGKNALKNLKGNYSLTKNLSLADPINFGNYPGQYSIGLLSKRKMTEKKVINCKITDFFKKIDIKKYKTSKGKGYPKNMLLFERGFNIFKVKIQNRSVYIIALHLTPDFNFKTKDLINKKRNELQVKFLTWYLNLDGKSRVKAKISPLKAKEPFIIIGDLNVDSKQNSKSANLLASLLYKVKSAIPLSLQNYTYPEKKLTLDYILFSKHFNILSHKIIKTKESDHYPIFAKARLRLK